MHSLIHFIRSIKPQIALAYAVLAAVIFAIVAGAVLGGHALVRANTIPVGEVRAGSLTVDRDDARAVDAEITLGFDEMTLRGGAEQLLELDFVTNFAEDPAVVYQVDSGLGDLSIEPFPATGIPDASRISEYRNQWDLRLDSETPMDLTIVLGMGEGNIDLRGMTLTGLTVELGIGDATVDLRGGWQRSFDVTIEGGMGEATVLLPDEVGVRASAEPGIGEVSTSGLELVDGAYVNSAYGVSDVTLNIEAEGGIGELHLEVRDEEETQ